MHLRKGEPSYRITQRPALFPEPGTDVLIKGILPGIKNFSGEKIQWYLASELRDRIRHSGVSIRVVDRTARAEFKVEPRQFEGRLLHELDGALPRKAKSMRSSICMRIRRPTRCRSIVPVRACSRTSAELEAFARMPWTSGYVQGIIDAPYLNLTPGTRLGVIHDAALARLIEELAPLEARLGEDHRGPAAGRGRAREPRCAALGAGRAQGGAAGAAGRGVRLVRPASRRRQAAAENARAKRRLAKPAASAEQSVPMDVDAYGEGRRASTPVLRIRGSAVFGGHLADVERHRGRRHAGAARDRARPRATLRGPGPRVRVWTILEGEGTLEPIDGEIATFRAAASRASHASKSSSPKATSSARPKRRSR